MSKIILFNLFFIFWFNCLYAQDSLFTIFGKDKNKHAAKEVFVRKDLLNKSAIKLNSTDSLSPSTSSLLSFGDGTAIDATTTPVIMPSPNNAVLTNLISENVDLYTGKTSVNLPLYGLKSGSISVPISLQANVNAHKVNEIGSYTGLGWNLNAGGAITRVMKSLPDEFAGNNISNSFQFPGWGYLNIKGNGQNVDLSYFDNPNPDVNILKNIIAKGSWNSKTNVPDRGWDLQPDEFYFNFGNYSGKFVFDQDGGINLIPQSNLKITPIFQVVSGVNKIAGFTVLTDDGFKYEFGTLSNGNYSQAPVEETKLTTNNKSMLYTYRAIAVNFNNQFVQTDGAPIQNGYGYYAYERFPYMLGGVPGSSCNTYGSNPNVEIANCLENFDLSSNNEQVEYFSYPSSWMLNKITSPTGDFVNFNYLSATISYQDDRSFSASLPDLADKSVRWISQNNVLTLHPNGNINIPSFLSPFPPVWDNQRRIYTLPFKQNFTYSKSTIELKSKKLISIITSDITVIDFNSTTPREDLIGDTRLDYLTVKNSNNAIVKKINFNYNIENITVTESPNDLFTYRYNRSRYDRFWPASGGSIYLGMQSYYTSAAIIGNPTDNEPKPWDVPEEFRKRMFLTSVQEEANGVLTPAYVFNYNPGKLPFRTSAEQDFYGFANENPTRHPFASNSYNGLLYYGYYYPYQSNTMDGAPAYWNGIFLPIVYFNTQFGNSIYGGNKNPSTTKMLRGVLNKITYPTGGYKEFQFEFSGNADAWNGLRVNQIREYESNVALPIIKNYTYGTFVNTDKSLVNEFGKLTSIDQLAESVYQTVSNTLEPATKRISLSSERTNAMNLTKGSAGGYTFGEIQQSGNGKYKVDFFTALDNPDVNVLPQLASCYYSPNIVNAPFNYPYPSKTSVDWKRGMPKNETIKNEAGFNVKYDQYVYPTTTSTFGKKDILSVSASKYNILSPTIITTQCGTVPYYWLWNLFGKTTYTAAWHPPIKKISWVYEQNGTNYTESIQEYDYRKYTYNNKDSFSLTNKKI